MRLSFSVLVVALGLAAGASAQTCTGLCQQQVSCPNGGTTSISGIVYAPNGIDPLPNVLVYVPNAPVAAFTPGVSCPVVGTPPSGSPLVGATTAVDGSFTIPDVPVGSNIPLVIVSGRWRRQLVIPTVTACTNTALPSTPATPGSVPTAFATFPQNQSQGDIPKIAIATGSVDAVECVLRKVGISDSEFTDPTGTGRIQFYQGDGSKTSGGAVIDSSTPAESQLMGDPTNNTLNAYDVLMLPCEGGQYIRSSTELANIIAFANAGGRVYSSHFAYVWMYQNPPFNTVANWDVGQAAPANGLATVNTSFSGGQELSQWLQNVGASTTPGQIAISTLKHDLNGVAGTTENWLDLNAGNLVMQMVFDTPVAATGNQCGRVLFNEYHVEAVSGDNNLQFPNECASGVAMTPQEKLLEYSLFELTNDGGAFTLTPATQDFGTQPVGFNSAVKTFTWTNNSTFTAAVTLLTGSQDFNIVNGNPCTAVPSYGTCQIQVVFNPSKIGAETGLLTVGSNGTTLTAALTGTGIPDLTLAVTTLNFGSVDVGASASQPITVTNGASGSVPVPPFVTTGDYTTSNNCGSALAAGASCTLNVIFNPASTGSLPGTVNVQSATAGPASTMTGNGIDFSIAASPASGSAIAGYGSSTVVTTTPLAGFGNQLALTCSTSAPGSTCTLSQSSYASGIAVPTTVTITTTAEYAVIGYGGVGGRWLGLLALATGVLLWTRRRGVGSLARSGLTVLVLALLLAAGSLGLSGCSGKVPAKNANYTVPGTYGYTVTATDGFLVHATTYSLKVTAN